MAISRDSTGKQFYRDFSEYADQAAYLVDFNNIDGGWALDAANDWLYKGSTNSLNGCVPKNYTFQDVYVRVKAKCDTAGDDSRRQWLGLRRSNATSKYDVGTSQYMLFLRKDGGMGINRFLNGSAIVIVPSVVTGVDPTVAEYDMTFIAVGEALEGLINGVSKVAATDSNITAAGYIEIGKLKTWVGHISDICVCSSPDIVCSGLPTGYKLKVYDKDGTTAMATESSGIAIVAGKTLMYPGEKVEVLNAGDVVVETYAASKDIWGGDAFAYSGEGEVVSGIMFATFI